MGLDPTFHLVMGIDDLLTTRDGEVVDPRFTIPPHAPADLAAAYGCMWWRYVSYDHRVPLPIVTHADYEWNRFHRGMQLSTIREHLIERPGRDRFFSVPGSADELAIWVRQIVPDGPIAQTDRAALGEQLLQAVLDWREPPTPRGRRLGDVLVWRQEYGDPRIIGFEVDSGGIDTWIWALCVHLGEAYLGRCGHARLPTVDLADDMSMDARLLKIWLWKRWAQTHTVVKDGQVIPAIRPNGRGKVTMREGSYNREARKKQRHNRYLARRKRKLIKNGWNVPSLSMHVQGWALTAHYLLRYIGLNVRQADLKPILYWTWS